MNTSTKFCPACRTTYPVIGFGKNRAQPDGLQSYCKSCTHFAQVEYREQNREKVSAYAREYYKRPEVVERRRAKQQQRRHRVRVEKVQQARAHRRKQAIEELM